jgi:hypothetical protein
MRWWEELRLPPSPAGGHPDRDRHHDVRLRAGHGRRRLLVRLSFLVEEACFDRSRLSHGVSLFEMNAKYADVVSVTEIVGRLERLAAT